MSTSLAIVECRALLTWHLTVTLLPPPLIMAHHLFHKPHCECLLNHLPILHYQFHLIYHIIYLGCHLIWYSSGHQCL